MYGVHKIYILHVPMTLEFSQQLKGKLAFSLFSQKIPNASKCTKLQRFKTNIPKTSDQTNPLSHIHPSTSPRVGHLSSFSTSSLRFKLKAQKLQLLQFQWELWGELVTQDMEFFSTSILGIIPEKHGHLQGCHPPSS